MTQKANLQGGRELEAVRLRDPDAGNLLRRIIEAVNRLAFNSGQSPTGENPTPPSIGAVNVKASGGVAHVTINDATETTRAREYFVEYDTNPNFPGPHVAHLGVPRGTFLTLPALNDSGAAQNWYFRAYSQEPGSLPSMPVYFGGLSPMAVSVGGSVRLTPLQSTGSGTASPLGNQGGWGRGKVPVRPQFGPKRSVNG